MWQCPPVAAVPVPLPLLSHLSDAVPYRVPRAAVSLFISCAMYAPSTASTSSAPSSSSTTVSTASSPNSSAIATYSTWAEHSARTKKSDTLIPFPIFSAYWLPTSLHAPTTTPASHVGTVVFGGGGGRAGTGVSSGLVVCDALLTGQRATPIELSPVGFLSTNDTIVMHTLPHPLYSELVLAVGNGTAVCHINHTSHTIQPLSHTQTDYATHEPSSQSQAFSPSGELLATGGEDRVVRVWRYRDMRLLGVCGSDVSERHKDMVLSLDFNSDGTVLASCGGDSKVQVWDTAALMRRVAKEEDGEEAKGSEVAEAVVPLLASVTVAAEKGQNVKFQVCKFIGGTRVPLAKPQSVDEEREGERTREEKMDGLRQRGVTTAPQQRQQSSAAPSSSAAILPEQLLAVCNLTSRTNPSNRLIAVAVPSRPNAASPASLLTFPLLRSIVCSKHQLTQMSVSPDARYLAVADNDGSVLLFHPLTFHSLYRSVQCHGLPATALCFTADSRQLLSASADKTFRFFDLRVVAGSGGRGGWLGVAVVAALLLTLMLLALLVAVSMGWMGGSAVRWRDVEDVLDIVGLWLTGTRSQSRMNARRMG